MLTACAMAVRQLGTRQTKSDVLISIIVYILCIFCTTITFISKFVPTGNYSYAIEFSDNVYSVTRFAKMITLISKIAK